MKHDLRWPDVDHVVRDERGASAMARAAKKTPRRGSAKAQARSTPAKRAGQRAGTATKRPAAKRRSRQQSGAADSWLGAVSTLAGAPQGREILAEVLEAAAATIRKQQQMANEMVERGVDLASEAATTTAEAVQQAASVLAEAVSALSPRAPLGAEESQPRRRRGRKAASNEGRQPG